MKNKLLAFAVVLAIGLSSVACAGGNSGTGSDAAPSSEINIEETNAAPENGAETETDIVPENGNETEANTVPENGEETEEEAVSDFAYIQQKGSIIIGYTVFAPMNYTDDEGNFTGFDTELALIVCDKLSLNPEFVEINWDTKEIELAAKTIDVVWNGLTITEERKQQMEITVPYLKNAQVVVMRAEDDYSDTSSLIGKTVIAEAGSAGEKTITEDGNLSQAEYISKEIQMACLMEVAARTADAAVLDWTLAEASIGPDTDYAALEIKDHLNEEFYGIAFRVGSDLCEMVNNILRELAADGTLGDLAVKYSLVPAL